MKIEAAQQQFKFLSEQSAGQRSDNSLAEGFRL